MPLELEREEEALRGWEAKFIGISLEQRRESSQATIAGENKRVHQ